MTFLCASISSLALWTRVALSVLCNAHSVCHGLGLCLPWSSSAEQFLQLAWGSCWSWMKVETGCSWLHPVPEVLEFFCANEQSFSSGRMPNKLQPSDKLLSCFWYGECSQKRQTERRFVKVIDYKTINSWRASLKIQNSALYSPSQYPVLGRLCGCCKCSNTDPVFAVWMF